MSKIRIIMATLLAVALATPALAADFKFSGDLNNRFLLYTDQASFFTLDNATATLDDKDREDSFASIKYRLTAEAATNDGKVKGVYGIELGAVRFGRSGNLGASTGGGFSGDGVNIETRLAYTDFQLPGVADKARVRIGLQPWSVNPFFWNETATAVTFSTDNLTLGWGRPKEKLTGEGEDWGNGDLDSLLVRYNHKGENYKAGVFANYTWEDISGDSDLSSLLGAGASIKDLIAGFQVKKLPDAKFDLITIGTDGSYTVPTGFGNAFLNWDLLYQDGTIDDVVVDGLALGDVDIQGYLLHADVGANIGATRLTLTSYYASGDDGEDDDIDSFISVDVDRFDSIILQEGGYTDDFYFTERPHIGPFGLWLTKLAVDQKVNEKLSAGAAVLYMMTAEDVPLADGSQEDGIGTEIDAYVSYKLYPNVEVALNAGYLFADDVMDLYETAVDQDGNSDVDIFRSTMRVRYSF